MDASGSEGAFHPVPCLIPSIWLCRCFDPRLRSLCLHIRVHAAFTSPLTSFIGFECPQLFTLQTCAVPSLSHSPLHLWSSYWRGASARNLSARSVSLCWSYFPLRGFPPAGRSSPLFGPFAVHSPCKSTIAPRPLFWFPCTALFMALSSAGGIPGLPSLCFFPRACGTFTTALDGASFFSSAWPTVALPHLLRNIPLCDLLLIYSASRLTHFRAPRLSWAASAQRDVEWRWYSWSGSFALAFTPTLGPFSPAPPASDLPLSAVDTRVPHTFVPWVGTCHLFLTHLRPAFYQASATCKPLFLLLA